MVCWIPCNWQDWAALATIVQALVVLIALPFALFQLREATRSRELTATTQLLTEIGSPKIREARRYVLFDLQPDFIVSSLTKEQLDMVGSIAVAYDRVGYMIFENLLPPKALFEFHGDDIGLVWDKIQPLVRHYRKEVKPERRNYCKHFKKLATEWLPDMRQKYEGKRPPPDSSLDPQAVG
jgi:hypothetical protein